MKLKTYSHGHYTHADLLLVYVFHREILFDTSLLKRYKKALDSAVKIATVHNVKPIRGTTYVFCNLGNNMVRPCTSARGLGRQVTVSWI